MILIFLGSQTALGHPLSALYRQKRQGKSGIDKKRQWKVGSRSAFHHTQFRVRHFLSCSEHLLPLNSVETKESAISDSMEK